MFVFFNQSVASIVQHASVCIYCILDAEHEASYSRVLAISVSKAGRSASLAGNVYMGVVTYTHFFSSQDGQFLLLGFKSAVKVAS